MKKYTAILLVLILNAIIVSGSAIPIVKSFNTTYANFLKLKSYRNMVFVIYPYLPSSGSYYHALDYFDGGQWINLLDGTDLSPNDVDFDKKGNLWVACSDALWHYDWKNWQKFSIDDSLGNYREFLNLCVDSAGNVWTTTFAGIIGSQSETEIYYTATYTELLKFDGEEFEVVEFRKGGLKGNALGVKNGLVCSPDNKVYVHDNIKSENDLYVYDGSQKTELNVMAPHSDIAVSRKFINQIYPDRSENLWFCFGSFSYANYDPGLSFMQKNGEWNSMTKENGMFHWRESLDFADSIYVETNAIYQDKNGIYWVGGQRYFGYLDEHLQLRTPDEEFFEKCILYGYKYKDGLNLPGSAVKQYLYDMTHFYQSRNKPLNEQPLSARLEWIAGTDDGSVWFAFAGLGILRYDPSSVSSVKDKNDILRFNVYPMPVSLNSGVFHINLDKKSGKNVLIKLYDLAGNLVIEQLCAVSGNNITVVLPDNMFAGNYALELYSEGMVSGKTMIIIN